MDEDDEVQCRQVENIPAERTDLLGATGAS
jgi:hypothetical protein